MNSLRNTKFVVMGFTAWRINTISLGIGENSSLVRAMICRDMDWCGLHLESSANEAVLGRDGIISSDDSSLKVAVIHTDEEMIIAHQTVLLIGG